MFADRSLEHLATCPLGRATDAVAEADRVWFEGHPGTTEYRRPVAPGERAEMRLALGLPDGAAVAGTTRVVLLADGLRVRYFEGLRVVPPEPAPTTLGGGEPS